MLPPIHLLPTPPVAAIRDLSVTFVREGRSLPVVRGVSIDIPCNGRVALVGESGCGKTLTCLSLGMLPPLDAARVTGSVRVAGREMVGDRQAAATVRGRELAYVFQDPGNSLNPVMRIGRQIAECLHGPMASRRAAAADLLARVRIPQPAACLDAYPCELSGGMQQRVMLAMALAAAPRLLVADEPTTALDVTTQAQVLDLVAELADAERMAVLLVTHNLSLVARRMDEMHVMYAGQVVESGKVAAVLNAPRHPYTSGLLAAVPRLDAAVGSLKDIPGTVPPADDLPAGCAFGPRCPLRADCCAEPPPLQAWGGDGTGRVRCWQAVRSREAAT